MACLGENDIIEYLAGRLTGNGSVRVEAHLASCDECRTLCAALSKLSFVKAAAVTHMPAATISEPRPAIAPVKRDPPAVGEVVDGKYRVERQLGAGGMGVVVAATHLALGQLVALKFLHPDVLGVPDTVGRFLREARAAVKLKSEHVARVIDLGTLPDGVPYIVMEHLEGSDLREVVTQRGALPVDEAVEMVLQALEAVAEAHAAEIVHRDLKPANLFLTKRADGSPCVKVLDFGISKFTDPDADVAVATTATKALLGSPLYMAPEQLMSARSVDPRADIWALGCILHELVSGKPLFTPAPLPELVSQILVGKQEVFSGGGPQLAAVLVRCMEKDRDRRFADVGELAGALLPLAPARARPLVPRIAALLGRASTAGRASSKTMAMTRPSGRLWIGLAVAGVAIAACATVAWLAIRSHAPEPAMPPAPIVAPTPVAPPVHAEPAAAREEDPATPARPRSPGHAKPKPPPSATSDEKPARSAAKPAKSSPTTHGTREAPSAVDDDVFKTRR